MVENFLAQVSINKSYFDSLIISSMHKLAFIKEIFEAIISKFNHKNLSLNFVRLVYNFVPQKLCLNTNLQRNLKFILN